MKIPRGCLYCPEEMQVEEVLGTTYGHCEMCCKYFVLKNNKWEEIKSGEEKKMRVYIACEYSGLVREAFEKRGHYAMSCDLIDTEIPGNHYRGDVFDRIKDGWDLMIAFPPCTDLAVSGARWFKYKDQKPAIRFFLKLTEAKIPKICVENPIGINTSI